MISFDLVVAEINCDKNSVGIEGGFCHQRQYVCRPYLHQEDLGVARNLEHAEVDDRDYLEHNAYRSTEDPWQLEQRLGWVMQM